MCGNSSHGTAFNKKKLRTKAAKCSSAGAAPHRLTWQVAQHVIERSVLHHKHEHVLDGRRSAGADEGCQQHRQQHGAKRVTRGLHFEKLQAKTNSSIAAHRATVTNGASGVSAARPASASDFGGVADGSSIASGCDASSAGRRLLAAPATGIMPHACAPGGDSLLFIDSLMARMVSARLKELFQSIACTTAAMVMTQHMVVCEACVQPG